MAVYRYCNEIITMWVYMWVCWYDKTKTPDWNDLKPVGVNSYWPDGPEPPPHFFGP